MWHSGRVFVEPQPFQRRFGEDPGIDLAQVEAATGWPLRVAEDLGTTAAPSNDELTALRLLRRRTEEAHRARS